MSVLTTQQLARYIFSLWNCPGSGPHLRRPCMLRDPSKTDRLWDPLRRIGTHFSRRKFLRKTAVSCRFGIRPYFQIARRWAPHQLLSYLEVDTLSNPLRFLDRTEFLSMTVGLARGGTPLPSKKVVHNHRANTFSSPPLCLPRYS